MKIYSQYRFGHLLRNKRKIIFFHPSLESGGVEKNLFSLIHNLSNKNYKIIFITYHQIENIKKNNKIEIINPSFSFIKNTRFLKIFFCFFSLIFFNFFKKIPVMSFQANIFAIIASIITRSKIVVRTNASPDFYIHSNFSKIIFSFFFARANLILVSSKQFQNRFKKFFYLKSRILRHQLDFQDIKNKSTKINKFNFFNDKKILKIISVGRLVDQKDYLTLLKAFEIVTKKRKARLIIIGTGNKKSEIFNFINKNNLNKVVKIISFNKNPFNFIKKADVFVMSSKFEGTPNALLETAALKRLIISTDCNTGPKEILQNGKGGILYKVGDYQRLSNILINLNLKNNQIKNMIKRTYLYVKKNYSADNTENFIGLLNKEKLYQD
jgi:glycosyltransferase involved in cell wall biosynthesis